MRANLERTARDLPEADFDAACQLIGDSRRQCYFLGGRFSDFIAGYAATHLRIVRPGVRRFEGQASTWKDQILDVRAGDVAVIFDIRRYQEDLFDVSARLDARKARIVLVTDAWLSPIARFARVVLPCHIAVGRPWDSSRGASGSGRGHHRPGDARQLAGVAPAHAGARGGDRPRSGTERPRAPSFRRPHRGGRGDGMKSRRNRRLLPLVRPAVQPIEPTASRSSISSATVRSSILRWKSSSSSPFTRSKAPLEQITGTPLIRPSGMP